MDSAIWQEQAIQIYNLGEWHGQVFISKRFFQWQSEDNPRGIKTSQKLDGSQAWNWKGASQRLFVVQLLSCVQLFETPWTTTHQASLSLIISWSSPKFMSIDSVMSYNHLILCHPLLLLPSIFPSIRVFSSLSAPRIRWPKFCSFSFSNSPSNEYSELISFRTDWFDLLAQMGSISTPWSQNQ